MDNRADDRADDRNDDRNDDWALMNQVRRNPEALGELFRRHQHFVYRVCWSAVRDTDLADDLAHDVFLRLARQRRTLRATARFRTWLYRVTVNVVRDHIRKRNVRPTSPEQDAPDGRASALTATSLGELERALDELSERQREVVVLRILEGFDTRETARALGLSTGSVKTHLHRALATLRVTLS